MIFKKIIFILIFVIFFSTIIFAQDTLESLHINVSDKITGEPIKSALVEISDSKKITQTDENGNLFISKIKQGKYVIKIISPGYSQKLENIEIGKGEEKKISFKLEFAINIMAKPLVITAKKTEIIKKEEISGQTLNRDNFKNTAGIAEDAFKVIHTLPGVVKEADFSAGMYVRGGEKEQNLVLVDRIYLGNPYHMGGFNSLINPDIIEKIDFYAGGMPAEGGQALSSVIDITTQEGNSEKIKGDIDISLLTLKLKFDGPLNKLNGNWLVSGRRSYYDLLLNAIDRKNTAIPNFGDYLEKFVFRPNSQNQLNFTFLQTQDNLKVDFENNEEIKDKTDFKKYLFDDFQNIYSLDWKYLYSKNFYIQSTLAHNREKVDVEMTASTAPVMFRYDYFSNTLRQDYTFLIPEHEIKTGLYLSNTDMQFKSKFRFFNNEIQSGNQNVNTIDLDYDYRSAEENNNVNYNGYFLQDTWKILDSTLSTRYGVRTEYFSLTDIWVYSPRLNFIYNLNKEYTLKTAWGHYYQFPVDFIRTSKDSGNPNLKPERADHYIAGIEHLFDKDNMGRLELYYKDYSQLIAQEKSDIKYSNRGDGFSKGFDLFLQRKETKKINGWITYTYCISKRKFDESVGWIYPEHDQRHTLSIVGNYNYSSKWTYSWTWSINSGKPYTPVIGREYIADLDKWLPVQGDANSARFPTYHRLDFKISRNFKMDNRTESYYLDIMNLYNAQNIYDYSWNKDYSKQEKIYSLPFIPFIGMDISF